jgi:hypothetical protein
MEWRARCGCLNDVRLLRRDGHRHAEADDVHGDPGRHDGALRHHGDGWHDAHADTDADSHADTYADTYAHANTDADPDTDAYADTDTHTDADPGACG